jgi:hypothetical protein
MWQENNNSYAASSSSHNPYYAQSPPANAPLQFYNAGSDQSQFYPGSRSSLEGNVGAQGSMSQQSVQPGYGGNIAQPAGGWWTAFGTGGFEGEPPLLEGKYPLVCPLFALYLTMCYRAWNKFFPYTRKITDGTEPPATYRRAYYG